MIRHFPLLMSASLLAVAACSAPEASAPEVVAETAAPTAAPIETQAQTLSLTPIVEELEQPWGMAFLPNGNMLVTEREGRINLVTTAGAKTVIAGAPAALVDGQGGYFDVILDPDFASNRHVYLSYAKGKEGENSTAIFKAKLSADGRGFENGSDIWAADLLSLIHI